MKSQLDLPLQIVYNQPAFTIQSDTISLAVTRFGGHMAPVEFYRDTDSPIMPYHIAPWWDEGLTAEFPPILHILRGDFFCCPFGGNDTPFEGVQYPVHGESANRSWKLTNWQQEKRSAFLHLSQSQTLRPGLIEKKISLVNGQHLVYAQHTLRQMEGPMDFGHHANLRFPDVSGSGHLSFSPFTYAQVYIYPTEQPENKGYSILQPGAVISDLTRVPLITGEYTDLTCYPDRRGFEDIVIICADRQLDFAWTAVAFPAQGYLWFALKDQKVLASTLLWMSNGGRHYAPWNGRHVNVMGLEEITGFFHEGLAASATNNLLNDQGIPTSVHLRPDAPLFVNYIQGVTRIPSTFDRVAEMKQTSSNELTITSHTQESISVQCHLNFLQTGII